MILSYGKVRSDHRLATQNHTQDTFSTPILSMLQRFAAPKHAIFLRTSASIAVAFGRRHLSSAAGNPQTLAWVATNDTLQRHPRLLSLETCPSPRRLLPILAFAVVSGLFRNPFVASRFLHSLTSFSPPDLLFAHLVFTQMEKPNLFSYNTMIRAFAAAEAYPASAAFSLYVEMLHRGALPDKHTFPFLLKACRSRPDAHLGRMVHAQVFILGFDTDPFVDTAIMCMHLSCGSLHDARRVFDEMPSRDVVVWTAVISGLANQGLYEEALEVFNEMRIEGLDVIPNVATMVSAMSACSKSGFLARAKSLHAFLEKVGLGGHVFVGNSLIDAYAKCGSIACAAQVFDRMNEKDLHSWTAMITGLASHGRGKEAIEVFSRIHEMGIVPDSTTFIAILSACSHASLVDEGMRIFDSMKRVYGISPKLKHYGCMVDLLSRAGLLTRAYDFVSSMPMEPNLEILGSLLSACRVQNDLELGELVAKKIELVCSYKGGARILLSNMYADHHGWNEVISIRETMRRNASKPPPGQSWIEA